MSSTRYIVFADHLGACSVKVRRPEGDVEVVRGFPDKDRANRWIREQMRAEMRESEGAQGWAQNGR